MCFAKTTTYHNEFLANNKLFIETCCEIRQGIIKSARVAYEAVFKGEEGVPQEIVDRIINSRVNSIVMIYVSIVKDLFNMLYPDDGDIHAAQAYNILKQMTREWFCYGQMNNGKYPLISNKSPSGRQFPGGVDLSVETEYHAENSPPFE